MTFGLLLGYGLIMVFSASIPGSGHDTGRAFYHLWRHGLHIVLGLMLMAVVVRVPVAWWQGSGPWLMLVGMVLLSLVLMPGLSVQINGSSRWFSIGPVLLQPSEITKLFVVIYTAGYLTRRREQLMYFTKGILMIGIVVGLVAVLLLMEPDFGSVVVLALAVFGMMFLGGVRYWHFLICLGAGISGMVFLVLISPYRLERVSSFLDPLNDPFNSGFQLVQALIAFTRGDWFGVGLGASIQKLHYLPAANTDFILSVIGEELGFAGVLAVIGLFGMLVWKAFRIARRAEGTNHIFAARLAQGLGLLFGIQAMINMGVNMGVLPTKGLTLPLMSYGGSSMLASCMAIGLLLAIERQTRPARGGRQ
jgi:cell division protein FtsW